MPWHCKMMLLMKFKKLSNISKPIIYSIYNRRTTRELFEVHMAKAILPWLYMSSLERKTFLDKFAECAQWSLCIRDGGVSEEKLNGVKRDLRGKEALCNDTRKDSLEDSPHEPILEF